jgi:two-component system response regulator FlrC
LKKYVEEGNFREDLYYRLNVFPIAWPALKERKGDIAPIAKHLIERHCQKQGLPVPKISAEAMIKLESYPWPGNVRELDNVVQRALILAESNIITADDVLLEGVDWEDASSLQRIVSGEAPTIKPEQHIASINEPLVANAETVNMENSSVSTGLGGELREQEYIIILETIKVCDGKRKEVSEKLGISPRTLRYKLAKMRDAGIDIPS